MGASAGSIKEALCITESDWEELLCDPVMAAKVIFGIDLDAFQACRLRYYWWIQNVMDSSGFSSGKTIVDWVFAMLRCILIPDQDVGVYYPVFDTGKNTFWQYFAKYRRFDLNRLNIFDAQLGRIDEKGEDDGSGTLEGAGCYKAFFKNGNTLFMPAPSFMKDANTQASMRFNTILIEEWPHIDASSEGIDKQLILRTTKPSWNQYHPIWGNHVLLTSPAKTRSHPGFKRYREFARNVARGNPACASLHYCYKDYSNLRCHTGKTFREEYRVASVIDLQRSKMGAADWLGEGYGIWAMNGEGWFTEQSIAQCVAQARRRGVIPVLSRAQYEQVIAEFQDALSQERQMAE